MKNDFNQMIWDYQMWFAALTPFDKFIGLGCLIVVIIILNFIQDERRR